jgi:LysM repeat protein
MSTSKLATPAKAAADTVSKAATVASRVPGVAARIAGLASRVNPIAGAAMAGATASQALGKLATGTETGRAIGKSIGRAINPPVSTLPKDDTTPAAAPKPSTVGIKKGDTMTSIAKSQGTSVGDLAKANPDIKDVNKISAGKSLNLPSAAKPAYTPKPVDQADTVRQSGGDATAAAVSAPKVAPTPPSRPADLGGKTSAPSTSASVPTPPTRPAELDLPKIDKGPEPGPASVPNPKVDAPTPPSRPADLGSSESKPMQNPDQERTKAKTVSESVVMVGEHRYRII